MYDNLRHYYYSHVQCCADSTMRTSQMAPSNENRAKPSKRVLARTERERLPDTDRSLDRARSSFAACACVCGYLLVKRAESSALPAPLSLVSFTSLARSLAPAVTNARTCTRVTTNKQTNARGSDNSPSAPQTQQHLRS